MDPVEIDYGTLTDVQLSDIRHAAYAETERRRYAVSPLDAAVKAIEDFDEQGYGLADEDYAQAALVGVRKAGWRIVRTDPNTETSASGKTFERPIIVEEWTP